VKNQKNKISIEEKLDIIR